MLLYPKQDCSIPSGPVMFSHQKSQLIGINEGFQKWDQTPKSKRLPSHITSD